MKDKLYIDGKLYVKDAGFAPVKVALGDHATESGHRRVVRGKGGGLKNPITLQIIGWDLHGGLERKWSENNVRNGVCTNDAICLSECWIYKMTEH